MSERTERGSTINPCYTFNYAQPADYHFSHDSVFLSRRAFEIAKDRLRPGFRLLDLCAGCGIVGLEFLFHARREAGVTFGAADFVELQPGYRASFLENVRRGGFDPGNARFICQNVTDFTGRDYDVVLMNPPYYAVHSGRPPASPFRARCHFLIDAPWSALVDAVLRARAARGLAFILTRDPQKHGVPGAVDREALRRCRLLTLGD